MSGVKLADGRDPAGPAYDNREDQIAATCRFYEEVEAEFGDTHGVYIPLPVENEMGGAWYPCVEVIRDHKRSYTIDHRNGEEFVVVESEGYVFNELRLAVVAAFLR